MNGLALVGHQFRYDQKAFWRNPASVFFTVMFPVILFLILAVVFSGEDVDVRGGIEATTYYVPAIMSLAIISATMQTLAMTLVIAREDGRLKRGRGTPMPPWVFIAGRVGNSIVVALMMLVLLAAIGGVLFGVDVPWDRLPAILLTLVVGAASFCCLGIALTAAIPSQDAAAAIVNALLLPLYFLSGVFIPEDQLPERRHRLRRPLPGPPLLRRLLRRLRPRRRLRRLLGQPRDRRPLGRRRPAAGDQVLPLDPAIRLTGASGEPPIASIPQCFTTSSWRSATSTAAPPSTTRCWPRWAGGGISSRTRRSAGASPNPSSSSPPSTTRSPASACSSFSALGIVAVKAAWENGVKSGGVSVSDPGEQRSHGSGSYSAFLKDPDGYEIEITIGSD